MEGEILTLKELKDNLKVSEPTIHRWIRDKKNPLPYFKIGQSLRFKKEDYLKWLEKFKGGETTNG